MARFNATGIEGLNISFEQFQKIPDSVVDNMLAAGGKVIVAEQKRSAAALGLRRTGTFISSIQMFPKVSNGTRYVLVYPYGSHHKYSGRVKTKTYARSKHGTTYTTGGGSKTTTNNDIGFIHEFGGHGNAAKNWMKNANARATDEMLSEMLRVYDDWLKTINL